MTFLLCALAICVADPSPTAQDILAMSESANIDFWKFTPFSDVSHWKIDFDKTDLQSVAPLFRKAIPDEPGMIMWVTSYEGVLRTTRGEYAIEIGEDKRGGKSREVLLLLLWPVKNGKRDLTNRLRFVLKGREAVEFFTILYREFDRRTSSSKPYKIESR
jgi:hypothetical protein